MHPLVAIAAVLRSGARVHRLHRVRAVVLGLLTAGVLGALVVDRLLVALLLQLVFVLVDLTCKTAEGLLRVAPEQLAALRREGR
jgi:hypothetical protein